MSQPQALNAAQAARAHQAFGLLGAGRAAEALTVALELCAASPASPDAQQLRGICLAELGRLVEAEQALRQAVALMPGQPALLRNLASLLRRSGQPAAALACWEQLVRAAPGQAQAWLDLGLSALDLGHTGRACQAFSEALRLQPDSLAAWQGLVAAQRAQDDLGAAEHSLRQGLARLPQAQVLWAGLALVLRRQGRPEEALQALAQAQALGELTPELLDARAGILLDAGQVDAALQSIQALTQQRPDFAAAQRTRALMLWEHPQDDQDPLAQLRQQCRAQPEHLDLQQTLLGLLMDAKRYEEALDQVRSMRRRGDHPLWLAAEADVLQRTGQIAQAAPLYELARRDLSGDPAFLNTYTRHLLSRQEACEAARCAEQVVALDPLNQEGWAYLGTAWRLMGDAREAWLCDYERFVGFVAVETPAGWARTEDFLAALTECLERLHQAQVEPMRQSLRGGSQTAGRLFGRADPLIEATRLALLQAAQRWMAALPSDAQHPFLRRRLQGLRVAGSWSVRLRSAGLHVNHIHNEGWLSSAFYVALPPSVRAPGQAGCLGFGQPPVELGLNLPPQRVVQPLPGHLALFPSYFWHGTTPFQDDEPRLTIAFDMLPAH